MEVRYITIMLTQKITRHISVIAWYLIIIQTQVPLRKFSGAQNAKPHYPSVPTSILPDDCGIVPLYQKLYSRSLNETTAQFNSVDPGDFRILNGLDAVAGEWPWIVKLTLCTEGTDDGSCMTCTGTLISSRWIVSAGHCGVVFKDKNFTATLGLYDLVAPDDTSFTAQIDKLIVHPQYNDLNNDLALLRLKMPVLFNDFVQPACLIDPIRNIQAYTRDKICYSIGYGLTKHMISAIKLQKLRIRTKSPSDCNEDKLGAVKLRRDTVCIGPGENTGGSCKGDSGGPDLCYDVRRGGRWILFGTVSYGPSDCDRDDDDDKWLTVSVNLASFRRWILTTVAENS